MKTTQLIAIFALIFVSCTLQACGQPKQKFSIHVVDENSDPFQHVECKAWFKLSGEGGSEMDYAVTGKTDSDGKIELAGKTIWAPTSVEARKEGYYLAMAGNHWTVSRDGNRWEPWPVELDFVMKPILAPRPMYVVSGKTTGNFVLPETDQKTIGFDLIKRDWVAPHGNGEIPDFLLTGFKRNPEDNSCREGWMRITFPNPGDGIKPLATDNDGGSLLMGPHEAPLEGYHDEWNFPNFKTTRETSLNPVRSSRVHAFRVRTKVDEYGNIIETYYGKLHDGLFYLFSQHAQVIRMTYYLNQRKNDRGLEWDMKTNLFEDITSGSPDRP